MDKWTGQDSGTSLVCEGGMSNGSPMDVHWTGRTIPSGQRILMANLDMSAFGYMRAFSRTLSRLALSVLTLQDCIQGCTGLK